MLHWFAILVLLIGGYSVRNRDQMSTVELTINEVLQNILCMFVPA